MEYYKLNLFLFDEGAGEAGGVASEGTPETAEGNDQVAAEDKAKAFEELIKGEYKDEFNQRVNGIVSRRFRNQKDSEAELGKYTKLADLLGQRYGTTDPDELYTSIDADDSLIEDKAYEQGLTVEQYRKLQSLSRENEQFKAEQERAEEEAAIQEIYQKWEAEAEEARKNFPNLDLEEECENNAFCALLENGFTVEQAYKAIHQDDIITAMMSEAASKAKQETVDNITSRGHRPPENGVKVTAGKESHFDVSSLTNEEIDEIKARVMRGERITL